ncbi:hypothetical protein HDV00_002582 [Rhizophlyctis rosea]|nr:hypothetical protein HDV00_002582 [Rhizophlyctis rosea]
MDMAIRERLLIVAARKGDVEVTRAALDAGADIHVEGDEALSSAALKGNVEVMALLLERGADVPVGAIRALEEAAKEGQVEAVRLLIDAGCDVRGKGDGALMFAFSRSDKKHKAVARALIRAGAPADWLF